MKGWPAEQLAAWSGGAWNPAPPPGPLRSFGADSRTVEPGQVFVALKGARTDGHDHVAAALAAGAGAALVARGRVPPAAGRHLLEVDDPLVALQRIAAGHRRTVRARIIGVTGSSGKTTTKELIAAALGAGGLVARTRGNWNNELGLPLSLLAMDPGSAFGVFELGISHPGEMAPLCAVLTPEWGVVTNVGPVHLEFFGSEADIAREKAVLPASLPAEGLAFLPAAGAHAEILRAAASGRVITAGLDGSGEYTAEAAAGGLWRVRHAPSGAVQMLRPPLPGRHQALNCLWAMAIAREAGIDWATAARALEGFAGLPMRWQEIRTARGLLINDAYNANPASMRAAIEAFAAMPVAGRRWLVLAGMRELGGRARDLHREVGSFAASVPGLAGAVVVGEGGRWLAEGMAGHNGFTVVCCGSNAEAVGCVKGQMAPGDAALFKASRGMRLEEVVHALKEETVC